jgi:hypothetical protein
MRSELLYTIEHGYDDELLGATLYDGAFVQGYGRGSGTVDWQGRAGTIEWTNFPTMRPDGVFLPSATGVIRLDDCDAPILYRMEGISHTVDDDADIRLYSGPLWWYTDAGEFLWLNDVHGYEEGVLDITTARMRSKVHVLHPEAP